MTREEDLASILGDLPRARRLLAPLREVREKEYGEPLPPVEFPVPAFATEQLPRRDAWTLFGELRAEERLSNVAVVVARSDAEVLAHFWENACPAARSLLSLRTSTTEPASTTASIKARNWAASAAGRRAIAGAAAMSIKSSAPQSVEWMTSLRQAYDNSDAQTVYMLDVEPWAAPLALTWLFTPERWDSIASTLRRWHEAHGFSVVALGADLLEAWVDRPPSTEAEIAARLIESVAFCDGYLDEGFAPRVQMLRGQAWQFRFGG